MTDEKCTCQKVPELNYVSSNSDCPVHYPKIDREKEWIEKFEEVWKKGHPPIHPIGCLCNSCDYENDSKPHCLYWWLESRRRFVKSLGHRSPSNEQAPKYPTFDFDEEGG